MTGIAQRFEARPESTRGTSPIQRPAKSSRIPATATWPKVRTITIS
jgi:hypothetical protein